MNNDPHSQAPEGGPAPLPLAYACPGCERTWSWHIGQSFTPEPGETWCTHCGDQTPVEQCQGRPDLDAIGARLGQASGGTWRMRIIGAKVEVGTDIQAAPVAVVGQRSPQAQADGEFIARARADIADLLGLVGRLAQQRDLAIAHDRQPYPTAHAYEQACRALHTQRQLARTTQERLNAVLEQVAGLAQEFRAALEHNSMAHNPGWQECMRTNLPRLEQILSAGSHGRPAQ